MPSQVVLDTPPAAQPLQLKILANKGIGPKIELKKKEEQYDDVLVK